MVVTGSLAVPSADKESLGAGRRRYRQIADEDLLCGISAQSMADPVRWGALKHDPAAVLVGDVPWCARGRARLESRVISAHVGIRLAVKVADAHERDRTCSAVRTCP